jgi:hypothetical protein
MKFHFKGFTSLLIAVCFVAILYSGVVLYCGLDRTTTSAKWLAFGAGHPSWKTLHNNVALIFTVMAIVHLSTNWQMFVGYVRKTADSAARVKLELIAALLLGIAVVGGSLAGVPPFSLVGAGLGGGPRGPGGPGGPGAPAAAAPAQGGQASSGPSAASH